MVHPEEHPLSRPPCCRVGVAATAARRRRAGRPRPRQQQGPPPPPPGDHRARLRWLLRARLAGGAVRAGAGRGGGSGHAGHLGCGLSWPPPHRLPLALRLQAPAAPCTHSSSGAGELWWEARGWGRPPQRAQAPWRPAAASHGSLQTDNACWRGHAGCRGARPPGRPKPLGLPPIRGAPRSPAPPAGGGGKMKMFGGGGGQASEPARAELGGAADARQFVVRARRPGTPPDSAAAAVADPAALTPLPPTAAGGRCGAGGARAGAGR